jgi:hypothetical protein
MSAAVEGSEAWKTYKDNYEKAVAAAQEAQEEMFATAEEYIEYLS